MKKTRRDLVQLAILVVLGGAVLLSLLLPRIMNQMRYTTPLEISVVIREEDTTLWTDARQGMEAAAGELGAELRFLTLSDTNDADQQRQLMLREQQGGADALVVVPADAQEMDMELPVVTMETAVEGADLAVAPDNAQLGVQLAQALLEDWTGGRVVLLDTGSAGTGVAQRAAAALETLEQAGVPAELKKTALEAAGQCIRPLAEEDEVWIMAFEPVATELAADQKEELGMEHPLYGVGVSSQVASGLERGAIQAAAVWSDYAAGYLAVQGAVEAARGKKPQAAELPFSVVRREDMYEPENQKLLFPVVS